jgi:CYTH domain-containing protein
MSIAPAHPAGAIPVARGLDTETGDPKYARLELERRWKVDPAIRPPLAGLEPVLIEDRYLFGTRLRLRRMTRGPRTVVKLTKKYDTDRPEARPIVTAYLTEPEYAAFTSLPAHALTKHRYNLLIEGHWWSLDLFEGALAGLELVEAEASDEAALAALVPPPWATKEVTREPRYQCGALAQTETLPE